MIVLHSVSILVGFALALAVLADVFLTTMHPTSKGRSPSIFSGVFGAQRCSSGNASPTVDGGCWRWRGHL